MLVVSRKENQRVLFPNLGITVEIFRIAGNAVRVGIDAPRDIPILRGELSPDHSSCRSGSADREENHKIRNRLNTVMLTLQLLQMQLESIPENDVRQMLASAMDSLADLNDIAARIPRRIERCRKAGRRALVVEDSANERELLAGVLRLCGYEVDAVEDGLAAMTHLAHHERPDVVVLDMQMPRMDGRKTISAIRRNPTYRGIKLFAVSGLDRKCLDVPLGKRGVDRWFTKPLHAGEFLDELNTAMNHDEAAAARC